MFGFARRVPIARTMRQPFAARRGGSSPLQGIAHFWSRGQNSKEKEEAAREPWPVSSGTIAKQLIMKPLLTGAGYGLGTMLVTSSFITGVGTEMLPGLIQFGIVFLSTNVAGGVGSSVGIISGATTCLIEGKWLVRALPISSVTKKLGSGQKLGKKAAEILALTLHDAARNQPPSPAPGSAVQALHVKSAVGLHAYDSCIGIVAHVSINVRGNLIMFAADDQSGSSNNTIKIERIRMPWAVSGDFGEMAPH